MEYFKTLLVQPLNKVLGRQDKINAENIAVGCTLKEFDTYATELVSFDIPHCYCIYIEHSDSILKQDSIDKIIPFFFNTYYLKVNNSPLLFISLPVKNELFENKLIEQFTSAAIKQGFSQVALQFIYKNTSLNLASSSPIAYYILAQQPNEINSETLKKIMELLLSGELIGQFLLIDSTQGNEIIEKLENYIEEELVKRKPIKELLDRYAKLYTEDIRLRQRSLLLAQQIQNTEAFLDLTRDSFNHDLHWYKSEAHKIKEWSSAEIKRLKEWHYWQYEVLPSWYKKMGKRILRFSKPKKGFEE